MEELHAEGGVPVVRPQRLIIAILNALVLVPGQTVDGRWQVQAVAVVALPGEMPRHAFQPGVAERFAGAFAVGAGGLAEHPRQGRRRRQQSAAEQPQGLQY